MEHLSCILKTIILLILTLAFNSDLSGQQSCISYPDIEGAPCDNCAPAGWDPLNIFQIYPHIIPPVDASVPNTSCTVSEISGASPSGGNVQLLSGDVDWQYLTGIETTISGLIVDEPYVLGMYWEEVTLTCAGGPNEGGVLQITIDGELFEFTDAEEWQLAEACFIAASSTVDVIISSTQDNGTDRSCIIVDGNPSCTELSPCCFIELVVDVDNYSVCPEESIFLASEYVNEVGSVQIDWDCDPIEGLNYLSATDVISPEFIFPPSTSFYGETYQYTFIAEDDLCEVTYEHIEVEVRPSVLPEFDVALCDLDISAELPELSDNGYYGTWTGDFYIELAGGTTVSFLFTLDPGQNNCLDSYSYDFYVEEGFIPTFVFEEMYCLSDDDNYNLPLSSTENVDGTWFPSNFTPLDLGVGTHIFLFTPDPQNNFCVEEAELEIEVFSDEALSFDIPEQFCVDTINYVLPTTSLEGVSGFWNVNSINLSNPVSSNTVVFMPNGINFCQVEYVHEYSVVEDIETSFSFSDTYCEMDTIFSLPVVSNDSISGTWSTDPIDPSLQDTLEVVFTPNFGQCSEDYIDTLYFTDPEIPLFTIASTMCMEGMYIFPILSDNGISGTWVTDTLDLSQVTVSTFSNIFTPLDTTCTSTISVSIEILGFENVSLQITDPTGCNTSDGSIQITGASSDMEQSIDNGMTWTPVMDLLNLTSGSYSVQLRFQSLLSCLETFSVQLNSPSAPIIQNVITMDASSCDQEDGSIECIAIGNDLEYSIDGISWQMSNMFTGLGVGMYVVSVRSTSDINCVGTATASIGVPNSTEICDGIDNDCDGEVDEGFPNVNYYADIDGDGFGDPNASVNSCSQPMGYVLNNADCDDSSGGVNPSAIEICDGIDNDCDGEIDEGFPIASYFADSDGDGFGDPNVSVNSCSQPIGYVLNNSDCDDSNEAVNPNANEICDGIDNNCDGGIDENLPNQSYYIDSDGDGFGNPNGELIDCAQPVGYVSDNTDCDDSNALIYPNSTEVCDGLDNNCDGAVDENLPIENYYVDSDADGFGNPDEVISSCTQPIGYVLDNTDCDDTDATINSNGTEICDGKDNNCDGQVDENLVFVDYYADVDMDGYGDPDDVVNDCNQPQGYVMDNTDCDDNNDQIYPGADEIPDNGIDEDCDGSDFSTAVHELAGQKISIYPNPTNGWVIIDIEEASDFSLSLYDISGKILIQERGVRNIDLSPYANGLYLLKLTDFHTHESVIERIGLSR